MSKSLDYFKSVYDVVPDWIVRLDEQSPEMLDRYTAIRAEAFAAGVLSRREKDLLVAFSNAGRLYPRSMLYHTKAAVGGGATVEEAAECACVSYLYGGLPSFRLAARAVDYAAELRGLPAGNPLPEDASADEILARMTALAKADGAQAAFLDALLAEQKKTPGLLLAERVLAAGAVGAQTKLLLMVGCCISQLDGRSAAPWIAYARAHGVREEALAELGYICIMTAGIPAWFELSDSLLPKAD